MFPRASTLPTRKRMRRPADRIGVRCDRFRVSLLRVVREESCRIGTRSNVGVAGCAVLLSALIASGCAANPADRAAQQASRIPILASVSVVNTKQASGFTLSRPTKSQGDIGNVDSSMSSPLEKALLAAGFVQPAYYVTSKADSFSPTSYYEGLALTSKGVAQGGTCKPNGMDAAIAFCDIPIGAMRVGKAEMRASMGVKFVAFDCTPEANDLGKQLSADSSDLFTNWHDKVDGPLTFDKKLVCSWPVGPDGDIINS